VRHFATAKLKLDPDFIAALEKFLAVPNLGQIIVLVDIDAKLDLLQLRTAGSFIFVVLGKIVTEFSERNDFADGRIGSGRHFDQVEAAALCFTQGIRQFQNAELLAARSQNDPDFASANAAVYTKLRLQISLISWTAKRECAISPVFLSSHNQRLLSHNADAPCFAAAAMTATKCPLHYSRAEGKL
jgi:hypothetical protein